MIFISTFENPLPKKYHHIAATGYRTNGNEVEGKWPIYPEMAAAGLWTTPAQLVQYGIAIQQILSSQQDGIIAHKTVLEILTPGENNHGLGPSVDEFTFSNGGADEGFRARFVSWKGSPYTTAVMVNSDNGAIVNEILLAIAKEYNLPGYEQTVKTVVAIPNADLVNLVGQYDAGDEGIFSITQNPDGLEIYAQEFDYKSELLAQSPLVFFESKTGAELTFSKNKNNQQKINWRGMTATKISDK